MSASVRDVLDHYEVDYKRKDFTDELLIICPFHDDTNFGSTYFNEVKEMFHCWGCGASGNIITFVKDIENISYREAEALVENDFNLDSYNLDSLKSTIEKKFRKQRQDNTIFKISEQIYIKIIDLIKDSKCSEDFLKKWYPVLSYLAFNIKNKIIMKEKNILDIYSEFINELSTQPHT